MFRLETMGSIKHHIPAEHYFDTDVATSSLNVLQYTSTVTPCTINTEYSLRCYIHHMTAGLTHIKDLIQKLQNSKTWMVITEHVSYIKLRTTRQIKH
jgi:hypothetical protein